VIACDTFEGPFADEFVGDFVTLDEAIAAAKGALSPMMAVYVYDDTGQLKFNQYHELRGCSYGQVRQRCNGSRPIRPSKTCVVQSCPPDRVLR
jgi:hypothetical protein